MTGYAVPLSLAANTCRVGTLLRSILGESVSAHGELKNRDKHKHLTHMSDHRTMPRPQAYGLDEIYYASLQAITIA